MKLVTNRNFSIFSVRPWVIRCAVLLAPALLSGCGWLGQAVILVLQ